MSLSGRPVYDPNPLKPNINPKKSVSGSCRVHGLGRTLTPLSIGLGNIFRIFYGKRKKIIINFLTAFYISNENSIKIFLK